MSSDPAELAGSRVGRATCFNAGRDAAHLNFSRDSVACGTDSMPKRSMKSSKAAARCSARVTTYIGESRFDVGGWRRRATRVIAHGRLAPWDGLLPISALERIEHESAKYGEAGSGLRAGRAGPPRHPKGGGSTGRSTAMPVFKPTARPSLDRTPRKRTIMHKPANDKPNVLPANVSKLRDELQRLATIGKPDGRSGRRQLPAQDARAIVIRGK